MSILKILAPVSLLFSTAAFAYGGWVAIVINPANGHWGSYHGDSTRYAAESDALAECGEQCGGVDAITLENGQSSLRETFALNGWVAYAKGNGHMGTSGMHESQYAAEQSALANCGGDAYGCRVIRSVSSFDYMSDIDGTRSN